MNRKYYKDMFDCNVKTDISEISARTLNGYKYFLRCLPKSTREKHFSLEAKLILQDEKRQ